jgi:hypothetical protein
MTLQAALLAVCCGDLRAGKCRLIGVFGLSIVNNTIDSSKCFDIGGRLYIMPPSLSFCPFFMFYALALWFATLSSCCS